MYFQVLKRLVECTLKLHSHNQIKTFSLLTMAPVAQN